MSGAFDIVMGQRKELVEKMVDLMQQDNFFNNMRMWNKGALRPCNPISNVKYRGGNRMRLMVAALEHSYKDPRWGTLRQFQSKGYSIKKGEHGIPCEKWIFTREKTVIVNGVKEKVQEKLENPVVSYFTVFNAEQIQDFPPYIQGEKKETELSREADKLISTSECPVREVAQESAFYVPAKDIIFLPPRNFFKDDVSFVKTLLHEMSHSTGHESRLNRKLDNKFGEPDYAKEELRAELGSLFTEIDLDISLQGKHYEDHSDYLKSWIKAIKDDYNEFFRACADAEKISGRLIENYCKQYELKKQIQTEIPVNKMVKARTR